MKHTFRKLTTLAVLTTATIHLLNKTINYKYQTPNYLYEQDNYYYEYRFGKVRYSKQGKGKPILLIHSLETGSSGYEYNKIYKELVKTNLVYSIDLLGYGLSDKPKITYTNYFYVQLIDSFIKNIIKEKTTIITSGNSSSIALMESLSNSETIDKLIFINPQYIYDMNLIPSGRNKILQSIFELPIYGTFFYKVYNKKTNFRNKFIEEYFYDPAKIKEQDIEAYIESAYHEMEGSKYSYSSYHNYYMNINFLSALKKCRNQIILLGGSDEKDIRINFENYKYYNDSIEIHYIPNTKKLPHLENPNEVLSKLRDI